VPGAFTPTCNDEHLPGYVNSLDRFKELGVERVAVITTNDRYVNNAWRSAIEACMQKKSGKLEQVLRAQQPSLTVLCMCQAS
jgi:peroxiredoxin